MEDLILTRIGIHIYTSVAVDHIPPISDLMTRRRTIMISLTVYAPTNMCCVAEIEIPETQIIMNHSQEY